MLEGIGALINMISDGSHSLLKRIGVLISIGLLLAFIDNMIGFTYYYSISNKLSSVEKIESLIKQDSISPNLKKRLTQMEDQVINRQDLFSLLWSFKYSTIINPNSINNQINTNSSLNVLRERNLWLQLISSAGVIYSISIFIMFYFFVSGPRSFDNFFSSITLSFILFCFGLLLNFLLSSVPILLNSVFWNYIVNFICQISLILCIDKVFAGISSNINRKRVEGKKN